MASSSDLLSLTAFDVMQRDIVSLPQFMPLREAATLLHRNQLGGAPVVDEQGKCVGLLSATDFLRFASALAAKRDITGLPLTCSFWVRHKRKSGEEVARCVLPPGACPVQRTCMEPDGEEVIACTEPHSVLVDWQMVEMERLPNDEVRRFMVPDPATARPGTPIRELAEMMVEAHSHHIIVVDEEHKPVGIVSTTNLLARIASRKREPVPA